MNQETLNPKPTADPAPPGDSAAASSAGPSREAAVLVVDDSRTMRLALIRALNALGFRNITEAANGKEALEALARMQPHLILLDVVMPEMDGFETCRRIKASEQWRHIPIIFLTGKTETTDIVQGFELGAVDYVVKPYNAHELLARVTTHLTMEELRRSLAAKNVELARAHELVRRAFGRYVSEEVATSILKSPEGLELGGEEREVTIMMSDLRGFTAMAARVSPKEVIAFLNVYLEAMVDVISRYEGTIDEIIGDGILVIFGAPVACPDHAERAVACALAMQLAMRDVNRRLVEGGGNAVEMGIGVHTGRVIVGNIGSERRTKYAAVGSQVNLAGRIESFTTGGQILISENVREKVAAALQVKQQFKIEPKGVSRQVELFEITGIGPPHNLSLPETLQSLKVLPTPVPVRFTVLEEKFVGRTVHEGRITCLSEQEAELESETAIAPLTNLKLDPASGSAGPPAGDIFAKVIDSSEGPPRRCRIRFTSVTPEMKAWLCKAVA